jgi:hypothetical protein
MGKTFKDDTWKSVRKPVPPPGYPIKPKTDYGRDDEKYIIEKGIIDYFNGEDDDLKPFWESENF